MLWNTASLPLPIDTYATISLLVTAASMVIRTEVPRPELVCDSHSDVIIGPIGLVICASGFLGEVKERV